MRGRMRNFPALSFFWSDGALRRGPGVPIPGGVPLRRPSRDRKQSPPAHRTYSPGHSSRGDFPLPRRPGAEPNPRHGRRKRSTGADVHLRDAADFLLFAEPDCIPRRQTGSALAQGSWEVQTSTSREHQGLRRHERRSTKTHVPAALYPPEGTDRYQGLGPALPGGPLGRVGDRSRLSGHRKRVKPNDEPAEPERREKHLYAEQGPFTEGKTIRRGGVLWFLFSFKFKGRALMYSTFCARHGKRLIEGERTFRRSHRIKCSSINDRLVSLASKPAPLEMIRDGKEARFFTNGPRPLSNGTNWARAG